jgi:hypothetical protein
MTHEQMYKKALDIVAKRLGNAANLFSIELFDALVAREILVMISANSENPGYEKAGALAELVLGRETTRQ